MDQLHDSGKDAIHGRRRAGAGALLALGPLVLGILVAGCEAVEDATSYLDDVADYVEDDAEIFGAEVVPGADEPYRSLHEVPGEAPEVASADERAAATAGLVADRETARRRAAAIRAGETVGDGQIRSVYRPARKEGGAASPDGE